MSWGEVFKINNNMKHAINEQLRDMKYNQLEILTTGTSYTPKKNGIYKIICVGAGYQGKSVDTLEPEVNSGASGGVAIKTMELTKKSYPISISSLSGGEVTFNSTITVTGASDYTTPGTANGGDYNFDGKTAPSNSEGGSVGVYIPELMTRQYSALIGFPGGYARGSYGTQGYCICNLGGGGVKMSCGAATGTVTRQYISIQPGGAGIIIIPIEMYE